MDRILYCVVPPNGIHDYMTLSLNQESCRDIFMSTWVNAGKESKWKYWYSKGYRVRKVKVTIREVVR